MPSKRFKQNYQAMPKSHITSLAQIREKHGFKAAYLGKPDE